MVNFVVDAKHKVLRLDVAMHYTLGVQILDAAKDLIRCQNCGEHIELPFATLHAVLNAFTQQLHDKAMIPALTSKVMQVRNTLR